MMPLKFNLSKFLDFYNHLNFRKTISICFENISENSGQMPLEAQGLQSSGQLQCDQLKFDELASKRLKCRAEGTASRS